MPTFGEPAMNYVAETPITLDRDVEMKDVKDFFVSYIQNDNLGQICSAHVAHADKEPSGIRSEKCLRLAALASTAVDFAKSGVPAKFSSDLRLHNDPDEYPDFMGKHKRISYKSEKVLGKLYREAMGAAAKPGGKLRRFEDAGSSREVDDIIYAVADDGKFEDAAETLLLSWNAHVLRLMNDFGVGTEAELLSGQVASFDGRYTQIRGRDHDNLLMQMNRQVRELRNEFREQFWSDDNLMNSSQTIMPDAYQKACCWYKVCKYQADIDRASADDDTFPILSFPWCVHDVLCKLFIAHLPVV